MAPSAPAQSESVHATTRSDSFWYLYQFTTLGHRTRYLPFLTSLFQSSLVGAVLLLVASFVANAMFSLSCATKFALAAILLYLVTSSAFNASSLLSSIILPPSLPLSLRSFRSCLFSSSASRPVSFASSVEMVLSFSASVSRLIISACLRSASYVIPFRGCPLLGSALSFPWPCRRPLPPGSSSFELLLQALAQPFKFRSFTG